MLTICLLGEELGAADCGIAIIFDHCWRFGRLIGASGTERQKRRYIPMFRDDPDFWVGTTQTEAERGGTANVLKTSDEPMQTTARRAGDAYVLNGRKIFISNGAMARLFTVQAVTDPTAAYPDGISTFIVTRDMPGLSHGKVYAKIGSRNLINAEVIFEDCRVPAENVLGQKGRATRLREDFLGSTHPEIGAIILGIARAAYEETPRYARRLVVSGKPIVGHQAVALAWPRCTPASRPPASSSGEPPGRRTGAARRGPASGGSPRRSPPTSRCGSLKGGPDVRRQGDHGGASGRKAGPRRPRLSPHARHERRAAPQDCRLAGGERRCDRRWDSGGHRVRYAGVG